jgi:septum formation protein
MQTYKEMSQNESKKYSLILASKSPRRAELLSFLGVRFDIMPAELDETPYPEERPERLVARLAEAKASKLGQIYPESIVLAADTTVVSPQGKILEKPADLTQAKSMLRALSGDTHQVLTGWCLYSRAGIQKDVCASSVTFRELSEGEIDWYAATGEGFDKAGGYAVQGKAGVFITSIEGSYTNIVGLPLSEVSIALKSLGVWHG